MLRPDAAISSDSIGVTSFTLHSYLCIFGYIYIVLKGFDLGSIKHKPIKHGSLFYINATLIYKNQYFY